MNETQPAQEPAQEETPSEEKKNNIESFGSTAIKSKAGNLYCLSIIGQIEGHSVLPPQTKTTKYEHLIPLIVSVEEDPDIQGMLIILNTVGGDVEAGLAIAELISGMNKPTVSLVLGGGHSIGVPLAVSANYSFIAPSASMTLHPIRMNGTIINAVQTFDYLAKMQERVEHFIVSHCGIDKTELDRFMMNTNQLANDVGTVIYGPAAVQCRLIDEIGSLSDALTKLYSLIDARKKNNDTQQ